MWFGFAEKYPTVNAFLVFPIKYPWKLTSLVHLYRVTFADPLAANFISVPPTHWQSSFWQVYFFTFPLHFTILKMKQEAICFLVWDILGFFHMWNNKNTDWGFFSLMLLEETWADHKDLQPIQEMFTVNRMLIYQSGFDLGSCQQKNKPWNK